MIFSSVEFLFVFLPITLIVFGIAKRSGNLTSSIYVLLFSSLIFYSAWNPMLFPLIIGSILTNFYFGKMLERTHSKILLYAGFLINLVPLVIFKYAGWLSSNDYFLNLALPLGISFYTFQQIAYLVDVYKEKKSEKVFSEYALFVVFFPQLIAGPIVHHKEMMPQFRTILDPICYRSIGFGLTLFTCGLFKKLIIADNISAYANPVFDNPGLATMYDAWGAMIAYTLQIYFDFSGYCEMAMGAALLFGIKLPINFNSPYMSSTISEFWRRWHITLGRFFKEYVYIPLGGSKNGFLMMILALAVTTTISGIWHGAGFTFLVWGLMHGVALAFHKTWIRFEYVMPKCLGVILTLLFVMVAWIFFRADSITDAMILVTKLVDFDSNLPVWLVTTLGLSDINDPNSNPGLLLGFEILILVPLLLFTIFVPNTHDDPPEPSIKQLALMIGMLSICIFNIASPLEFLYFEF